MHLQEFALYHFALFFGLFYKKINVRENRRYNEEWTIQRKPKVQSRMDNPEKTEGAIKNGQSRKNRRCNQEWTIQRNSQQKTQYNMCWTPLYANKHK